MKQEVVLALLFVALLGSLDDSGVFICCESFSGLLKKPEGVEGCKGVGVCSEAAVGSILASM